MAVDSDRGDLESVPEDDRRRLATDAAKADQALHRVRNDAAELVEDLLGRAADGLRLLTEEAGGVDVALELRHFDGEIGGRPWVLLEEHPGHLVDPLVARLRGEDRGDQELERCAELERRAPVRIGLGQASQDGPRTAAKVERRLLCYGRSVVRRFDIPR